MLAPHETAWRRASVYVACLLAASVVPPGPALAQSPSPPPLAPIQLRLAGGPVWHERDDDLGLRLRVINSGPEPLEGFRVIVGIEDRVLNRSSLETSFETDVGIASSALPIQFDETVPENDSITITLAQPVADFPTLAGATDGGVYPAGLTIQDAGGTRTFASLKVPLIYYPEEPDPSLNIALLVPLNERPTRLPGGSFVSEGSSTPLADAVLEGGWLAVYLDLLEQFTSPPETDPAPPRRRRGRRARPEPTPIEPLHLSVGMTPRTVEELSDIADGFQTEDETTFGPGSSQAQSAGSALDTLGALLRRGTVQATRLPYAFPDLPTIVRELSTDHALEQMNEARTVFDRELGIEWEGGWLFPPAGRLDAPSLEQAKRAGVGEMTFISHDSLIQPDNLADVGCPELSQSFTCPIRIDTPLGETQGLSSDAGLSERLSWLQLRAQDRLTLQQFFAETAMIREELPGVSARVIQATVPSLWHPSRRDARVLLKGVRDAPWMTDVTADEALETTEPVQREIVDESRRLAVEPDPLFFQEIERADAVIDSYQAVVPPDNRRLSRLRSNLLTAQDRTLWRLDSADDYVDATRAEAEQELHKIGLEGAEALSCTSRECQIQLVLTNDTSYPVEVAVELESPDLELSLPAIQEVFQPGSHPLSFDAIVRGSGVFNVAARLRSGDRGFLIQEKRIVIRSTNFNRIALVLTVGAFAFLVLFYLYRAVNRRRTKATQE